MHSIPIQAEVRLIQLPVLHALVVTGSTDLLLLFQITTLMFAYLIQVDHDVALGAHAADHVLQSESVVDPRRV